MSQGPQTPEPQAPSAPTVSTPRKTKKGRAVPIKPDSFCEEWLVRALNPLEEEHNLNRPFSIPCLFDGYVSKLCSSCNRNKRTQSHTWLRH
jgi:hypothetical protein